MRTLERTKLERINLLIVTAGPKAGEFFCVPCYTPKYRRTRKLKLRNARWVMTNTTYERVSGFLQGYKAGLAGDIPEAKPF
jgi:hypothetical protein